MNTATATTIPARFAGPPFGVNGGYAAGLAMERLGVRGAHVQLRAPVPMDTLVEIAVDETEASIRHDGQTLLTASPASLLDRSHPPVDFVTAALAAGGADRADHPFPDCLVCGPNRSQSDGMHLLPGEVRPGLVASSWRPLPWQADPTGTVPLRMATAALDCPSYFAFRRPGEAALLVAMTVEVRRLPHVSEHLVVTGWSRGEEGRKRFGASAIATAEGETLGRANTLWITVDAADLERIASTMAERAA